MGARVISKLIRRKFPGFIPILLILLLLLCSSSLSSLWAQESPYIVTYNHYLEEPGNLEVEYFSTFGTQRGGNAFHAFWTEFEYGATAWWTTDLHVDGQTTFDATTAFTSIVLHN